MVKSKQELRWWVLGWVMVFIFIGSSCFVGAVKVSNVVYLSVSMCEGSFVEVAIEALLDSPSLLCLGVVCIITGSVVLYSLWYMDDEVFMRRFVWLLVLFVSSMVLLVLVPNMLTLLFGWDGLGLISFLLVVYYSNQSSMKAGLITAFSNRIGDVMVLCSCGFFMAEGGWTFYGVSSVCWYPFICWFLLVAGMTKSAQVPFSAWLPAAMAAPTPVSALVHSSTLVTAGVYLLYRSSGVFLTNSSLEAITYVSLITMILAGSSAMVEVDMKKIVALSTLSQLSVMMLAVGFGVPEAALFHLLTHAIFKALLFLCVGVVIHINEGSQDLRFLGGAWERVPVSMACMEVALIALCGVPFLSGFYSKDWVIEAGVYVGTPVVFVMLIVMGVATSWLYSMRLVALVFSGLTKSVNGLASKESEGPIVKMSYSLLLVGSVLLGFFMSDVVQSFFVTVEVMKEEKQFILLVGVFSLAYFVVNSVWCKSVISLKWSRFLGSMWHFKGLSGNWSSGWMSKFSGVVVDVLEKGWVEEGGPKSVRISISSASQVNQVFQSSGFFKLALVGVVVVGSVLIVGVW